MSDDSNCLPPSPSYSGGYTEPPAAQPPPSGLSLGEAYLFHQAYGTPMPVNAGVFGGGLFGGSTPPAPPNDTGANYVHNGQAPAAPTGGGGFLNRFLRRGSVNNSTRYNVSDIKRGLAISAKRISTKEHGREIVITVKNNSPTHLHNLVIDVAHGGKKLGMFGYGGRIRHMFFDGTGRDLKPGEERKIYTPTSRFETTHVGMSVHGQFPDGTHFSYKRSPNKVGSWGSRILLGGITAFIAFVATTKNETPAPVTQTATTSVANNHSSALTAPKTAKQATPPKAKASGAQATNGATHETTQKMHLQLDATRACDLPKGAQLKATGKFNSRETYKVLNNHGSCKGKLPERIYLDSDGVKPIDARKSPPSTTTGTTQGASYAQRPMTYDSIKTTFTPNNG